MFWDFLPRTGDGDASTAECYEHFTFMDTLDIPIKSTVKDNGSYTVEWAIPWSLFDEANKQGYEALYTGTEGISMLMMITVMDNDGVGTQALGYSTVEWTVPATTDIYTLVADPAGIIPEPEPEPVEMPAVETPSAAPVAAPATGDVMIAAAALAIAAAGMLTAKKIGRR